MGLFRKRKKKVESKPDFKETESTYERIVYEQLSSDEDHYLTHLADQMLDGAPLILSFDQLEIDEANKAIAFFSGIVYAVKGEIVPIREKVFMFANQDVYADQTMQPFLTDIIE